MRKYRTPNGSIVNEDVLLAKYGANKLNEYISRGLLVEVSGNNSVRTDYPDSLVGTPEPLNSPFKKKVGGKNTSPSQSPLPSGGNYVELDKKDEYKPQILSNEVTTVTAPKTVNAAPKQETELDRIKKINRSFEQLTGFSLDYVNGKTQSAVNPFKISDLIQSDEDKREKEKYNTYKNAVMQLQNIEQGINNGTINPVDIGKGLNNPIIKNSVQKLVSDVVPQFTSVNGVVNTNDVNSIVNAAKEIKIKNRSNGVVRQQQLMGEIDAEINNLSVFKDLFPKNTDIKPTDIQVNKDFYTLSQKAYVDDGITDLYNKLLVPISGADNTQLSQRFSDLTTLQSLIPKSTLPPDKKNELSKVVGNLLNKASYRSMYNVAENGVVEDLSSFVSVNKDGTIKSIDGVINSQVVHFMTGKDKMGDNTDPSKDNASVEQMKLGLSWYKNMKPADYSNIMNVLKEGKTLPGNIFHSVMQVGQDIYNMKVFKDAASNPTLIDAETNIDYTTFEEKQAAAAGVIGEYINKKYGGVNKLTAKERIKEAGDYLGIAPEITKSIIANEYTGFVNGIPRGRWVDDIIRGAEPVIGGIYNTISGLSMSDVEKYIRANSLLQYSPLGGQKVPQKDGSYGYRLGSQSESMTVDALEGVGQFLAQLAATYVVGGLVSGVVEGGAALTGQVLTKTLQGARLGSVVARTEISPMLSSKILEIGGTAGSMYLQSYGSTYDEWMDKTGGDKEKSMIAANILAVAQAATELIQTPLSVVSKIKDGFKAGFADDLVSLIRRGGDPALLRKEATKSLLKRLGQGGKVAGGILLNENEEELIGQWFDYTYESLVSPQTAINRDLSSELVETVRGTTLSMLLPALLGFGGGVVKQKFTQEGLRSAASSIDVQKNSLQKLVNSGEITQDEVNNIVKLLETHKQSMDNAPTVDNNFETLSSEGQNIYALQETRRKIFEDKLKDPNVSKVQKEQYEKVISEIEDIQRDVLSGKYSDATNEIVDDEEITPVAVTPEVVPQNTQTTATQTEQVQSVDEKITELQKELDGINDKTNPRVQEINNELAELEKQKTPEVTPEPSTPQTGKQKLLNLVGQTEQTQAEEQTPEVTPEQEESPIPTAEAPQSPTTQPRTVAGYNIDSNGKITFEDRDVVVKGGQTPQQAIEEDIKRKKQEELDSVDIAKGGKLPIEGYDEFYRNVDNKYNQQLQEVREAFKQDTNAPEVAPENYTTKVREQVVDFHDGLNAANTVIDAKVGKDGKFYPTLVNGKSSYMLSTPFNTKEEADGFITSVIAPEVAKISKEAEPTTTGKEKLLNLIQDKKNEEAPQKEPSLQERLAKIREDIKNAQVQSDKIADEKFDKLPLNEKLRLVRQQNESTAKSVKEAKEAVKKETKTADEKLIEAKKALLKYKQANKKDTPETRKELKRLRKEVSNAEADVKQVKEAAKKVDVRVNKKLHAQAKPAIKSQKAKSEPEKTEQSEPNSKSQNPKKNETEPINQVPITQTIESKAEDAERNKSAKQAQEVVEQIDKEIGKTNEQQARDKGEKTVNGVTYKRKSKVNAIVGKVVNILFAKDDSQKGHYAVIEADDLQASHNSGVKNEMHFIPEAQPRDRGAAQVLRAEAEKKGNDLNPEQLGENNVAYFGAPVVNEIGEVVQGNGRAEAILYYRAQHTNDPKGYTKMILDNAAQLGLNPDEVAKMKNPVLVRMIDTTDIRSIQLGNYSSSDLEDITPKGTKEKAAIGRLTAQDATNLANAIGGQISEGATLKGVIRDNAKTIIDTLIDARVLRADEKELFIKNGEVTPEGIETVYNTIRQLFFEGADQDLRGKFDDLPFRQREAIEKSIPTTLVNAELRRNLHKIIEALHDHKESGSSFNLWRISADMFNEGKTPNDTYSKANLDAAKKISEAQTQKEIVTFIQQVADEMKDKEATLFDAAIKGLPYKEAINKVLGLDGARLQKSEAAFTPITKIAFNMLVARLNKVFGGAVRVLGLDAFNARAKELGVKPIDIKYPDGTVYGAVLPDGSMYLNPEKINANTPIHEHTHLFNQVIQKVNPKLWGKIVAATKKINLWDEVKNDPNYSNLKTDNAIADEVFSRIVGNKGEGSWQERIAAADNKSVLGKLKGIIKEYWNAVKEFFGADIYKDMSADDFADMTLDKLLGGKEIKGVRENIDSNRVQEKSVVKKMAINGKETNVRTLPQVTNGFYSPIEKKLLDEKATNLSATKWLERLGKGDEMVWTGLKEFLESKKPNEQVKKSELQAFMKDNRIEVVEVVKGERSDFTEKDIVDVKVDYLGSGSWVVKTKENGTVEFPLDKADDKNEAIQYALDQLNYDNVQKRTDKPKFGNYQLAGEKENYKEVLVTLPRKPKELYMAVSKKGRKANGEIYDYYSVVRIDDPSQKGSNEVFENIEDANKKAKTLNANTANQIYEDKAVFKSSHFDEKNILIHLRMNTRTDSEGNKVLFLEEVQSDWGQAGKKEGFKTNVNVWETQLGKDAVAAIKDMDNLGFDTWQQAATAITKSKDPLNDFDIDYKHKDIIIKWRDAVLEERKLPSAPFVTDTNAWTKLGLKVALKEAVAHGEQMQRAAFEKLVDEKMDWVEARMKKLGKLEVKCP